MPDHINSQVRRLFAVWKPPSDESLRTAIDAICTRRNDPNWTRYVLDGRETDVTAGCDPDSIVSFYPPRLSSLRFFRCCHTNDGIWRVAAHFHTKYEPSYLPRVEAFFQTMLERARGVNVCFFVSESGEPCDDIYGEFSVRLGHRRDEGASLFAFQIAQYRRFSDGSLRRRFFENAIDMLGLRCILTIVEEQGAFRLEVGPGWALGVSGADVKARNASSFTMESRISFRDAWARIGSLLGSVLVKRIDNLSFSAAFTPDQYERIYDRMNEFATGWEVSFYGSYADGIDPYTADASKSPDGRFPVVTWLPEKENDGVFFEADIVPTPEGRFLEIHSNCGDMARLIEEAEAATGVKFTPIAHSDQP